YGSERNKKLQAPNDKQIPNCNIQISIKIKGHLFGILNFCPCDFSGVCVLIFEFFLLKPEH
ncbi:MAG: hypothetical protein PVI94_25410, partial [Desulfobacterales bacterium]